MFSSNNPTYSEPYLTDDWGFYIDIEAHDWNQVNASAPIQIQIQSPIKPVENNVKKTQLTTKEEVQRYIEMSSREEKNNEGTGFSNLNLNLTLRKTVTIAIIAICAFY